MCPHRWARLALGLVGIVILLACAPVGTTVQTTSAPTGPLTSSRAGSVALATPLVRDGGRMLLRPAGAVSPRQSTEAVRAAVVASGLARDATDLGRSPDVRFGLFTDTVVTDDRGGTPVRRFDGMPAWFVTYAGVPTARLGGPPSAAVTARPTQLSDVIVVVDDSTGQVVFAQVLPAGR